eukprot:3098562-Rhodomonas_salina.2
MRRPDIMEGSGQKQRSRVGSTEAEIECCVSMMRCLCAPSNRFPPVQCPQPSRNHDQDLLTHAFHRQKSHHAFHKRDERRNNETAVGIVNSVTVTWPVTCTPCCGTSQSFRSRGG